MNARFLSVGIIGSLALHGLLLLLFALTSGEPKRSEEPGETIPERPAPVAETNEAPVAEREEPKPEPKAKPVRTSKPKSEAAKGDVKPEPEPMPEPKLEPRPDDSPDGKVDAKPKSKSEPKPSAEREWVKYVVKKGDTLTGLVRDSGCSLSEIARKNKRTVASLSKLKVGQRILLPKKN